MLLIPARLLLAASTADGRVEAGQSRGLCTPSTRRGSARHRMTKHSSQEGTLQHMAVAMGGVQAAELTLGEQVRLRQRWSLIRHILRRQEVTRKMGCTGQSGYAAGAGAGYALKGCAMAAESALVPQRFNKSGTVRRRQVQCSSQSSGQLWLY